MSGWDTVPAADGHSASQWGGGNDWDAPSKGAAIENGNDHHDGEDGASSFGANGNADSDDRGCFNCGQAG